MNVKNLSLAFRSSKFTLRFAMFAILIVTLACSLPGVFSRPTPTPPGESPVPSTASAPTPTPAPTATPQPLPPAIVESNPPLGGEVPLDGPITLYFNQPMDRPSVESALDVQPALDGKISWNDDTTLVFAPSAPLAPESEITFSLATGARSRHGLALPEPLSLSFQAVGYLSLAQMLPEPDASLIDPSSAVVASFNRPLVPLGADPASLPAAFRIEPEASGRAEWLNTSTYIFYPEPPLEGGKEYNVVLNPDLRGVDGSPLESSQGWRFFTAEPRLAFVSPDTAIDLGLGSPITMTFNQPMDPASVEANFALLRDGAAPVDGNLSWNEDFTTLAFQPDSLLERSTRYDLRIQGSAQARGGTPLAAGTEFSWRTVSPLRVARTTPSEGSRKLTYGSVQFYLTSPVSNRRLEDYVSATPPITNMGVYWDEFEKNISVYGDFAPDSDYTISLSPDLSDMWGGKLSGGFSLSFRTESLPPNVYIGYGTDVLFLTPQDASLIVQVTNFPQLSLSTGSLPLDDFMSMVSGPDGYTLRQNYSARDERTFTQNFELAANRSQAVDLFVSPERQPLSPGLYYLRLNTTGSNFYGGPYLLVVGDAHLTFKLSATQATVWAVDLRDNAPIAGAPITIYNESGQAIAQGSTDAQGVFQSEIPVMKDPWATYYAMLGQPIPGVRDNRFGMALSTWSQGISSWEFGIPTDYTGPTLKAYLYTDRPIYRPGQTVYFRAIVRQAYNGRYDLPTIGSLPLTVYKNYSEELASFDLPLSAFGTVHGEFTLPPDAPPGDYRIARSIDEYNISVSFKVAEYRKPEINLQASFAADQILGGEELLATVDARYFFDAPAGNLPVSWALYETPSSFYIPEYQVGVQSTFWLDPYNFQGFYDPLGAVILQGESTTDPQGKLALSLPTEAKPTRMQYTLEATITDESGLPVSTRAVAESNPAEFYVGLRPDAWAGRADDPSGFDVLAVDWSQKPAGVHPLRAEFQKVVWVEEELPTYDIYSYSVPRLIPQYTLVGSTDFETSSEGKARLEFTPTEPGTYMLSVAGEGAASELLLWVGGAGTPIWPNLPFQRLQLVADLSSYQPGDSAEIFVPNPLGTNVEALITVERGVVLRTQVQTVAPGGVTLSIPLSAEDAPNVFVSVTLLGRDDAGDLDFRQGFVNLPVDPRQQTLSVELVSEPERLGPGEDVTFEVKVSDNAGAPVQGEFSLSVVDLAVLALADPNVPDIVPYFYGEQPLGVRTGLTLAAYARRKSIFPLGGGGGGGDGLITAVVRERFPDTAYWNAEIVTGPDGRASVSLPLPDSLTTWQVLVRGVGDDTRVGQAEKRVVVTKDFLVRPVTPRFLTAGDHVQLAAVVQNNTAQALEANVSLEASGLYLDNPDTATQTVSVPANGRARVEWWGSVQDVASVDLIFATSANGYQDATRPTGGSLPVLRYTAPQTFATSGILDEGGERLELVSLPRTFDPLGGDLNVELSSSLGGSMITSLTVLENTRYESTESTLSRFLPNMEAYRTLQALGIDAPNLRSRLDRTMAEGIARLLARQQPEGGWSWHSRGPSDPYVTAYVLFGLARAREAGTSIPEDAMQRAGDFLVATLYTPDLAAENWQIDRLAFIHFALAYADRGDLGGLEGLYQRRDQLSPWGQALLALAIQRIEPDGEATTTLYSDLSASAIRSATGAHWETQEPGYQNMSSHLLTTAMVVYSLAQQQPDSPLLPDAVRYLMAHRRANGSWGSTYTTAWSLMALVEVMRTSGELGGSFAFSARLNGIPIATGQASGEGAPVVAEIPIGDLYTGDPNALVLSRAPGSGRLYYTAGLNVFRPVEDVTPLQRGVSVQRLYYPTGNDCPGGECDPITDARPGDLVRVRLTLTLEDAAYYLLVEDHLPAGTEVLDTSLKTSQFGIPEEQQQGPQFDPSRPFEKGWGWWYFTDPRIYDDHLSWASSFVPAGTYELTYLLVVLQPGEYRVLPANSWMFYFPEVQGNSAGAIFTVQP